LIDGTTGASLSRTPYLISQAARSAGSHNFTGASFHAADRSGFNLADCILEFCDLSNAILERAQLSDAIVSESRFTAADLSSATLVGARIHNSDFARCNLRRADLREARLYRTSVVNADLEGANLEYACLLEVDVDQVNFTTCRVYGISVWDLTGQPAQQTNLTITREEDPTITTDNIEVAQFIYLFLNNQKIRQVIDTITSKVVLILGRFTPERKTVLDSIRDELRKRDYTPVLFDFEKPSNRGHYRNRFHAGAHGPVCDRRHH
jgi:uncharacterized protein YjbI with pentapeptide repeats